MEINYRKIVVKNSRPNDNIYTYLKNNGYSENYLKNLRKQKGFIKLNDTICFINQKVCDDDIISVNDNPNTKTCISYCNIPLDIVYKDDQVLAVNKPSGLATMPSRSHYANNLCGGILNYFGDQNFVVRVANRLDKEASGIVLVACNSLASNFLNKQENVKKTYYALVCGNLDNDVIIQKNIQTICVNGKNENKRIISDSGKQAITQVKVIKNYDGYCLVKINITFGRTHQIRVHLSSIGHALLGDELYGQKSDLISHTALCLKELEFVHPTSNNIVKLSIDFPDDFKKLI